MFTGVCNVCHLNHGLRIIDGQYQPIIIQTRFSHHGTLWHLTYRVNKNETMFTKVEKRPVKPKDFKTMEECTQYYHRDQKILPTFVSPQRFIEMVVLL